MTSWNFTAPQIHFVNGDVVNALSADLHFDAHGQPVVLQAKVDDGEGNVAVRSYMLAQKPVLVIVSA